MPQFDTEPRQRGERIDDQPTAVTDVIALVGIRRRLGPERAVLSRTVGSRHSCRREDRD